MRIRLSWLLGNLRRRFRVASDDFVTIRLQTVGLGDRRGSCDERPACLCARLPFCEVRPASCGRQPARSVKRPARYWSGPAYYRGRTACRGRQTVRCGKRTRRCERGIVNSDHRPINFKPRGSLLPQRVKSHDHGTNEICYRPSLRTHDRLESRI